MLQNFAWFHLISLGVAILLDVLANIFLKLSNGFKNKRFVILALLFVLAAFTALSFSLEGIQLSIAYGIWGGAGLVLTAIAGILIFKEKIRLIGWVGILLIISGIVLLRLSHLF